MAATNNKTRAPARRPSSAVAKRNGNAPVQVISMVPVKAAAGGVQWVRRKPTERTPHVVAAGVYGIGATMNVVGASPLYIMLGTVTAAGIGYIAVNRRTGNESVAGLAAASVAAAGSWVAAASEIGVLWGQLWGPLNIMTLVFLAMYGVAYRKHLANPVTVERKQDREDQIWWMEVREAWKLPNSHLISITPTRLGEKYVVNIMGTGKLASSFVKSSMEEYIAAIHKLPRSRVKVREGNKADRIVIYIRHVDPWANPITHPLLDSAPEIELAEVADICDPVAIGQDPETGKPLTVEVVDPEEGANRVMVVGMSGAGKTVLVNSLLERLTAADNAMVCCIDLSKAKEMRRFRKQGALGPSAFGKQERVKAMRILQMACKAIEHRAEQSEISDEVVHVPRPGSPAIVLVIDEVDALFEQNDRIAAACAMYLNTLLSKGRSEMVSTIMIGQRGTARWMGGANIRANFNVHIVLKVQRPGEMRLAMGEIAQGLPDMSKYGEGHKGVAIVVKDGDCQAGRTFFLRSLTDLDRLAEGRRPSDIEAPLKSALGNLWTKLTNGEWDAARPPAMAGGGEAELPAGPFGGGGAAVGEWTGDADEEADEYAAEELGAGSGPGEPPAAEVDTLQELDAQMEEALPDDLRRDWEKSMENAHKNLDHAREVINSRVDIPEPTPEEQERLNASAAERWRQLADQTVIAPEHMVKIMALVERPEGASSAELQAATGIAKTNMWRVLNKLQQEQIAHRRPPRGRNARIYAGPAPDAGGHGQ